MGCVGPSVVVGLTTLSISVCLAPAWQYSRSSLVSWLQAHWWACPSHDTAGCSAWNILGLLPQCGWVGAVPDVPDHIVRTLLQLVWPHGECDHVLGGQLQGPGDLRVDGVHWFMVLGPRVTGCGTGGGGVPQSGADLLVSE